MVCACFCTLFAVGSERILLKLRLTALHRVKKPNSMQNKIEKTAGKLGVLIPAGQPEPLVATITSLLRDPAKRQRMGNAGRDYVRDEFSFTQQANAYLQLFARLGIGNGTSGRRAA